jgi:hypothetical protein
VASTSSRPAPAEVRAEWENPDDEPGAPAGGTEVGAQEVAGPAESGWDPVPAPGAPACGATCE